MFQNLNTDILKYLIINSAAISSDVPGGEDIAPQLR